MKEKDDERTRVQDQRDEFFNTIRSRRLREYVTAVRTTLHTERLEEKKKRYNEAVQKYCNCIIFQNCNILSQSGSRSRSKSYTKLDFVPWQETVKIRSEISNELAAYAAFNPLKRELVTTKHSFPFPLQIVAFIHYECVRWQRFHPVPVCLN